MTSPTPGHQLPLLVILLLAGLMVLVGAGLACRDRLREEWLLYRLRPYGFGRLEERRRIATGLASRPSPRLLERLLDIVARLPEGSTVTGGRFDHDGRLVLSQYHGNVSFWSARPAGLDILQRRDPIIVETIIRIAVLLRERSHRLILNELEYKDEYLRYLAASLSCLQNDSFPEAREPLLKALDTRYIQLAALISLHVHKFAPSDESLPLILDIIRNGGPVASREAAWWLVDQARACPRVVQKLTALLKEDDHRLHNVAILGLSEAGPLAREAVPLLEVLLEDTQCAEGVRDALVKIRR